MVTFARARAKSIFSKLRITAISKKHSKPNKRAKKEELSLEKDNNSHCFLEAIKTGGIWLS